MNVCDACYDYARQEKKEGKTGPLLADVNQTKYEVTGLSFPRYSCIWDHHLGHAIRVVLETTSSAIVREIDEKT